MRWLFVDMDGFFASVEQHLRPPLRGRPVGVVPVETDRTCVIASSFQAKRHGVKVGTRVPDARRLCPGIVLVKARPDIYVRVHHQILRSVDLHAPVHRVYSIDEWAVRLTGPDRARERAVAIARAIKGQIARDLSPALSCSVGIADTRLLAKIACDLEKPDGLTLLPTDQVPTRLAALAPDDLPGIAAGNLARLHAAGVRTIGDLWAMSRRQARDAWGSVQGEAWWLGFHGYDVPEPPTQRRTLSHAHVLPPAFRSDAGAHGILARLITKGAQRLRDMDRFAHRLHLAVSLTRAQPRHWDAQAPLDTTQDTGVILDRFESLWAARPWADDPDPGPVRVSMILSGLMPASSTTRCLFDQPRHRGALAQAIDRINDRWGDQAVFYGSLHAFRHHMDDKIAFGRVPGRAPTAPLAPGRAPAAPAQRPRAGL